MLENNFTKYAALLTYTIIMSSGLVMFGANAGIIIFVLVASPMLLLWWKERLLLKSLPFLTLAAALFALLISAFAHMQGAWYEISNSGIRLLGHVPVESLVVTIAHVLYFVTMYEYFFDDRKGAPNVHHQKAVSIALLGILSFCLGYLSLFSNVIVSYAFFWIILGLVLLGSYVLLLFPGGRLHILFKTLLFSLAMIPLSLVYEYTALANNLRFFANPNEYLFSFTFYNQLVPLEELLFIILVPLVVALYYEMFFDDGK